MAERSLGDLTADALAAHGPSLVPASTPRIGGVDPLGLRQINFDLMDRVFPGLNNVARHTRPFVVVTWAWRRAQQQAKSGADRVISTRQLQDFVDRIELIYVWSQFLRNPDVDLPGGQVIAPLLKDGEYAFTGPEWEDRKKVRRYSTALSAPVNYGPGLKSLGWLTADHDHPDVMTPTALAVPAIDALEARLGEALKHPVFNQFEPVVVRQADVREWASAWAVEDVTREEAQVMRELLFGDFAPLVRRRAGELLVLAAGYTRSTDDNRLRAAMAGAPSGFEPPAHLVESREAWRRVQVRQLFRLSLEATFYWVMAKLHATSSSMGALVDAFVRSVASPPGGSTSGEWLAQLAVSADGPVGMIERVQRALDDVEAGDLPSSIAVAIAFCLSETPEGESQSERRDRLPLYRAREEAAAHAERPVDEFVRHLLGSWVLAQHAYWSVGRGLADARVRGRILLRLRVILEEGGWTLTPGVSPGLPPRPTADRLYTAIRLAKECGLLSA